MIYKCALVVRQVIEFLEQGPFKCRALYLFKILKRSDDRIWCQRSDGFGHTAPRVEQEEVRSITQSVVIQTDVAYAQTESGTQLLARLYQPSGKVHSAVVEVHGGAWNTGDRTVGEHYNLALAEAGIFVCAIDFRHAPQWKHPQAGRDIVGALLWLRHHADVFGFPADQISIVGSSSGGHLAMFSALLAGADLHRGTTLLDLNGEVLEPATDTSVRKVIALWPVSDPAYRYAYAKRVGRSELVSAHENYFADVAEMEQASVARVLNANEHLQLPELMVVQPGEDKNVPIEMTDALVDAWRSAGGYVDYGFYPRMPHGFAHRPSAVTDRCTQAMVDFLKR
jgi:acetyl esterase/lipase